MIRTSLAAAFIVLALSPGSASAAQIVENFDNPTVGANGWTAVDADDHDYTAQYSATNGHPGGYLQGVENIALGGTGYFIAPSSFLGNLSSFAGGKLSYDLKVFTGTDYFQDVDVIITGTNGHVASWTANINPVGKDWVNFSVNLVDGNFTGDPLSSILSSVADLQIRGEVISGPELEGIDNVTLMTAAVPEPSTWSMMILGFCGLGFLAACRRRQASAARRQSR